MSGRLTLALSEQMRSMTRWILTDSHHLHLRKKESIDDRNQHSMKETRESNGSDNKFKETNVIPGGALVVDAPEFQLNIIAPAVNGGLTSLTSDALEIPSAPSVLSEYDAPPFVDEVCEVHPSAHELSHFVAHESSVPVIQTNVGVSASSVDHIQEVTDKLDGLNLTVIEERGKNNWDHIFRSSARKELHTVTGTSLEKLDNLEQLSSCATLQSFNHYSSPVNMVEGSNLTAQNLILPLGNIAGLPGYYNFIFYAYLKQKFLFSSQRSLEVKGL